MVTRPARHHHSATPDDFHDPTCVYCDIHGDNRRDVNKQRESQLKYDIASHANELVQRLTF
jgi:wyosine [tRNA(Phe)-imidazoG37] synthetase (radical SAM superfamily)